MNLRAVLWLLGCVLLLLSAFLLVPAFVSFGYGERRDAFAFVDAAAINALIGGALWWFFRGANLTTEKRPDFFRREGLAVVGLSWLVVSLGGAIPFVLCQNPLDPVDAIFESASGFTTTGSTILPETAFAKLSRGVLFWRSFTHWLGGIGIVLVFVVLFPTGGRSLYRSEVPGIAREAVLHRVRDSALALLRVYVGLTVLEMGLLLSCDLSGDGAPLGLGDRLYEAAVHSFGTLATGGFSTHAASIRFFDSWKVELIVIVFMFAAGINFALYDSMLRAGPRHGLRLLVRSPEVLVYTAMIVGSIALVTLSLWFSNKGPIGEDGGVPKYAQISSCLRDASFLVVSLQTSTGYGTANYNEWPEFCRVLLMFLAFVGACAGSTGGGLKVIRFMILAKASLRGFRAFARPRAIYNVRLGGQTLDEGIVASILGYCGMWALVFGAGTLYLAARGTEPVTGATAVLATLNNIGPGLGDVGPSKNFAGFPADVKALLTVFMIVGRLEFYAVVVLFVPRFWRH